MLISLMIANVYLPTKLTEGDMNANEHIRKFLKIYIEETSSPGYAVLLRGKWGVGKTWFMTDFLKKQFGEETSKFSYVSLYGIRSTNDIDEAIFRQQHPVLGSKGVQTALKLGLGILKLQGSLDLDSDGKKDLNIATGNSPEELSKIFGMSTERLLIFDDIERCSMKIGEVMGYINQYVEYGGFKVILVANEEELEATKDAIDGNNELSEDSQSYIRIREKLIGRTFEIMPEFDMAFQSIVGELHLQEMKQLCIKYKDMIAQLHEWSGYRNLRILKYSIIEFERLHLCLENEIKQSDGLIKTLIFTYLVLSIELRKGAVQLSRIKDFLPTLELLMERDNNSDRSITEYKNLAEKYVGLDDQETLFSNELWQEIFASGVIPKAKINLELKNSSYLRSNNQPSWVQYLHAMTLSDDNFQNLQQQILNEWAQRNFTDFSIMMHVFGALLMYAEDGLTGWTRAQTVTETKTYIDDLFSRQVLADDFVIDVSDMFDFGAYGFAFQSRSDPEFQEVVEYLAEKNDAYVVSKYPKRAADLLALLSSDVEAFANSISFHGSAPRFARIPIFSYFDTKEFVNAVLNVDPMKCSIFGRAIKRRYEHADVNSHLGSELAKLEEISTELDAALVKLVGKMSHVRITHMVIKSIKIGIAMLRKVP